MSATFSMRIHLRGLVLALTVFSAIAATANALYASYCVQRDQLIANTLESNRVYAAKLAESAANFLKGAQQQLRYSAQHVADALTRPPRSRPRRAGCRNRATASIPWASSARTASSWRPRETFAAFGARVDSPGSRAALQARQALISPPYVSIAGNLLITLSHPIYSAMAAIVAISRVRSTCATRAPCRNCWAATITRMAPICTWWTGTAS